MHHKLPMKQTIFGLMDIQNYQQFFWEKKSFAPSQKRAIPIKQHETARSIISLSIRTSLCDGE
jgi:hypothetical protein